MKLLKKSKIIKQFKKKIKMMNNYENTAQKLPMLNVQDEKSFLKNI